MTGRSRKQKRSRDPNKRAAQQTIAYATISTTVAMLSALVSIFINLGAKGTLSVVAVLGATLSLTLAIRKIMSNQSDDDRD